MCSAPWVLTRPRLHTTSEQIQLVEIAFTHEQDNGNGDATARQMDL